MGLTEIVAGWNQHPATMASVEVAFWLAPVGNRLSSPKAMFEYTNDRNKDSVTNRPAQLRCDGGSVAEDPTEYHLETFVGTVVMEPDDDGNLTLDDGTDTQTVNLNTYVGASVDGDLGDDLAVTGIPTQDDTLIATDATVVETPFFGWCADCMARHEVERVTDGCQCGGQVIPKAHADNAGLEWNDNRELVTDGGRDVTASDLTHFRLAQLIVIADLEREDKTVYGLAIKRGLEAYYGEEVNHGRLYPNLDDHVDDGLVGKRELDARTNEYTLTDAGRGLIESHVDRVAGVLGKAVIDEDPAVANVPHDPAEVFGE